MNKRRTHHKRTLAQTIILAFFIALTIWIWRQ